MHPFTRFLGLCLVISLGLAVLELIGFVGISNIIAIPFTISGPVSVQFFRVIAVVLTICIALYGLRALWQRRWIVGTSTCISILWAYAIGYILVMSTAFEGVPTT